MRAHAVTAVDNASVAALFGELFTAQGREQPYPVYRALHAHGPVVALTDSVVVVLGYDAAVRTLRDPALVVEDETYWEQANPGWRGHPAARLLRSAMLFTNGAQHRKLRDPLRTVFSAKRIAAQRPDITRSCERLAERLAEHDGPFDFMADFAVRLPVEVACGLIGVPADAPDAVAAHATTLGSVLEPGWLGMDLTAADQAAEWLSGYFGELVASRRRDPRDDVITRLATAGTLDDDEIVANLVLLLIAGLETTTSLLGSIAATLAAAPDHMDVLRGDPDRVVAFVEEVLRCESPVQLTARRATTATQVDDVPVAPGATVAVLLGAANRDPAHFAEPDRFRLDRPDGRAISFGGGPHHCLGATLARVQAQVAVPVLVRRFREFRLTGVPRRHNRFNLRGFTYFPVIGSAR